jgi:sensor histidine kinase YesM
MDGDNYKIAPDANSIVIELNYYNRDLLPRYFSTALQFNNDSIVWSSANINTIFNFTNLNSGNYIFHVKICQLDGSITYKQYHFYVDEFWYKKWWIIGLIALGLVSILLYLFHLRNLKKVAEQKALTQAAQFENTITQKKNEMAKLQAVSISNQFRPHFLLNTLNAIGSYLYKQPEAEKLLSRTGESINILFSQARSNNNIHSIASEMDLVNNVIEIFKIVYLKDLQVILPTEALLQTIRETQVPFGLLQIPIENAMLHGLNNKSVGPYHLHISLATETNNIIFTITDNGIGRAKASTLSNTRKHGTGLVNLYKIIEIYNQFNTGAMEIHFKDNVFAEADATGTQVTITIPINYHYGS